MFRLTNILLIVILSASTALATLPGAGTEADPYRIESAIDFSEFKDNSSYWDDYIRLETDIPFGYYQNSIIAPDGDQVSSGFQGNAFTGVFDGNDHSIESEICPPSQDYDYIAIFGKSEGTIKNLDFDVTICRGSDYVGGLVGHNEGDITNCHGCVDIETESSSYIGGLAGCSHYSEIVDCYVLGELKTGSGSSRIGGLVGENDGPVSYCYTNVSVDFDYSDYVGGLIGYNQWSLVSKCYALGDVIENTSGHSDYVGGLVGYNDSSSSIKNCYAHGGVEGNDCVGGLVGRHSNSGIRKCYSTGVVMGSSNVGGLVGKSDDTDPDVYNSYWDKDTSGKISSDGGTKKSFHEMMQEDTFSGWDFSDVWNIAEGRGYPAIMFYNRADLNADEIVDFKDLAILAENWLKSSDYQ